MRAAFVMGYGGNSVGAGDQKDCNTTRHDELAFR